MEITYYHEEDAESRWMQAPAHKIIEYCVHQCDRSILLESFVPSEQLHYQRELELEPREWLQQLQWEEQQQVLIDFIEYCQQLDAKQGIYFFA